MERKIILLVMHKYIEACEKLAHYLIFLLDFYLYLLQCFLYCWAAWHYLSSCKKCF